MNGNKDKVDIETTIRMSTCEDFYDTYLTDSVSDIIDEMYWENNYSSDRLFEYMTQYAAANSIVLVDSETFDHDKFFWNVWQNTEKGLS